MDKLKQAVLAAIPLLVIAILGPAIGFRRASAAGEPPPGPDRFTVIDQEYTRYEWWLTAWADNQVACTLEIDHAGLPLGGEVYSICGKALYDRWMATRPCTQSETDPASCTGYYLVLAGSEAAVRQVPVALPEAVVWVTLDGCAPYNSTFRCDALPTLVLTGEEPLSGEYILSLAGRLDGSDFTCDPLCQVDLAPTGQDGLRLEFWATSSYGDTSRLFEAHVRVIGSDDPADPTWYVDVLTDRWRGDPLAGCSQEWHSFPPVGGVPAWLSTPQRAEELVSNVTYEYLSARLLRQGIADGAACPDGGLTPDGQASPCGLEAARPAVVAWQNRFDGLIFDAARATGVPAQLLKNLFGRESQFWPGVTPGRPEAGLGQLTGNGADTALLWNRPFFEQFCPGVLDDALCRRGYPHLSLSQQEELRRALVDSVDAFCADCPLGLDLVRAEDSIAIFAETLLANCAQAGALVGNTYNLAPGEKASYEDLWRLTLVNYNAGPGCLTLALQETKRVGEALNWANLASHLTPACRGALDYVEQITRLLP
jgi:hypothetical protein